MGVGLAILIIVVVVGIVALLHSARFHRYILGMAQQKASAALGTVVQIREYALTWSGISPTLDVYNFVVLGAEPYPNPPLLTVDHARVGVTIQSLLHRTWYLNDVTLDHPVVRVFQDRKGGSNLPQMKSSGQSNSNTSVFDLGVRHAVLDRGEVYYDDRKTPLEADLHDLDFHAGFDPAQKKYSGTLGYRDGHLRFGVYNPIPHDLQASFTATPQAFTLERATLNSGRSQFVLNATVENYSQPVVNATYDARLDTGEFRRILKNPSLPAGVIRANGDLKYVSNPNRPMLDAVTVNGTIKSGVLAVETPSLRTQIQDLGARYSVANGNAEVRDIHAQLLGGTLTGQLVMHNLTGATRSNLTAALRGVSLAALKPMMTSPAMQQVSLAGTANATADATWGKTMNDLVARTDATLQAQVAPANGGKSVPLDGAIHARYAAPSKQITLANSFLRTKATSLDLNGTVSNRSALQVQMRSNDLHELETVSDMFRRPAPGQPAPQPLGLYGTASFNGAVRGSTSAPELTGQLTATTLRVKGSSWRVLRTNVDVSPSVASLTNGQLQPADRGNITFNLRTGLHKWSFTKSSPFQVGLNASQVNITDLTRLAGSQAPITGTLNANLKASGTQLDPVGNGTITISNGKLAEEPLKTARVDFQGTGNELNAKLAVQIPAGGATARVTYYPKQEGYVAQLQATGIQLAQLQTLKARNAQIAGVVNLNASGQGTVKDPQLNAMLQIPQLTVRNQKITGLTLQAAVANHVANVALDSQVVNTSVRGRATVNLTGDYMANATLDTQSIPFEPLVAAYAPSQAGNITGQTELHATVRGPLKNKMALDAHVTIPQLAMAYKNTVKLAAASPIHLDFTGGVLTLQRAEIRGTGTDLQFEGRVPVADKNAPASLLLLGNVDLQIAQLLNPDISSGGQLQFNINSFGQRANPDVQGQIRVVNASFATGEAPLGLQNGNGVLTLTKDRLNITQFQGTVGGGEVRSSGGVVYRPGMRFDLALEGRGIRLLYPEGVRSGFDTNLALTGTTESALLRGVVRLDQLSFTPDFDLMSISGSLGGGEATPPPASGFSQNLRLDIQLQSNGINAVSRQLSIEGSTNLQVRGTAADPVILGRVNLTGGDLIFQGNRYVLQGGTIDFINPSRTTPNVNVAVNTTIQQYNIQMRFWGPADHLHTNYASDPALPPSDIINLIAFGKTSEASAANPTPPGSLGAESLVASQVSSQVTNRVEKVAGISQLSVDPELGGNGGQQNPGARVAIQQRVTSKIYVTFASDVTSTQNQTIRVEYHQSPKLTFSGVRDQNGGFAFDTKIHKVW